MLYLYCSVTQMGKAKDQILQRRYEWIAAI